MASNTIDLSAATVPLIFTAGDDAEIPVRFGTTSGGVFTPFDLGDWLPTMHIRRQKTGELIDTLTLWIKAATTESLLFAKCEVFDYDLQITVNSKKRTYIAGTITLNRQITTG